MKTKLERLICNSMLFFSILAMASSYAADTNSLRFSTTVKVKIISDDDIKNLLISYLKRELRSLNDVEIVENDPEWIIYLIAAQLKMSSGKKTGDVAISATIAEQFNNKMIIDFIKPDFKYDVLEMTSGLGRVYFTWIRVGPMDDLHNMFKELVSYFDIKYLEVERQKFKELKKQMLEKEEAEMLEKSK